MSKLKKINDEDLITISDTFGDFLEEEISKIVSTKELEDIDLGIVANYLDDQLDVSCNVELLFDELTERYLADLYEDRQYSEEIFTIARNDLMFYYQQMDKVIKRIKIV